MAGPPKFYSDLKKEKEAPASVEAVAVTEDAAAKDDLINVDESATLLQGQVRRNQSKKRVEEMITPEYMCILQPSVPSASPFKIFFFFFFFLLNP